MNNVKIFEGSDVINSCWIENNQVAVLHLEKMKGLCHKCYSSGVLVTLINDMPVCNECRLK